MKRLLQIVLAALGLSSACAKSGPIDAKRFTQEFREAFTQSQPALKIEIVRDLELAITSPDGRKNTMFLNNAYEMYTQDPSMKSEVIQKYLRSFVESVGKPEGGVDKDKIVAVVKDRPWMEETRQALIARGAKKTPDYVFDDLNAELVSVYAEDSETGIHYLTPERLEKAQIAKADLRALSVKNLQRIIPKIEALGTDGFYMVRAGGDYEASVLLFDSIWNDGQFQVKGDIVVAIPARDVLLVTGSQDAAGLKKMRGMVAEVTAKGSYKLTPKLFVYRNRRFDEFSDSRN